MTLYFSNRFCTVSLTGDDDDLPAFFDDDAFKGVDEAELQQQVTEENIMSEFSGINVPLTGLPGFFDQSNSERIQENSTRSCEIFVFSYMFY